MHGVLEEWRPAIDETIESLLPRTIDEAYLSEFFGQPTYAYDPSALQHALSDPVWDLLDRGGKRWRAVLFLVFVDAFGDDPESYLEYAVIPGDTPQRARSSSTTSRTARRIAAARRHSTGSTERTSHSTPGTRCISFR